MYPESLDFKCCGRVLGRECRWSRGQDGSSTRVDERAGVQVEVDG